jgi:hypothetical protein
MRTVLLLLVVGLLIAWYFYRQGLDKPEERQDRANEIAGRRFLASEAPNLPLPGCNATECDCHFIHHNDRRTGKDRRSPFTSGGIAAATGTFSGERRKGEDRRDDSDDY